jgi:hypothetical protein
VGICPKASPKIIHISNKALDDMGIARDNKEVVKPQFGRGGGGISVGGGSDNVSSSSPSTMPSLTSSFFVTRTTPGAKPSIKSIVKIKEKQEVDKLVGKCSYGVTFLLTLPRTSHSISLCLM